ncbi:MAG TPA: hypothetical protein VJT09_00225 [Pyrinomonadaceae bacterium]|nr:hypothetical protein [Pyrinomonadaceae bacterium]
MYCSSCGGSVAQGLSYCNHCGAKLAGAKSDTVSKPSESLPESLIWATVAVFVVGIGTTIGLMAMMKELLDLGKGVIIAFGLTTLLLTFILTGVFIYLLLKSRRGLKEVEDGAPLGGKATRELEEGQARALPEPLESVTEQTTRAFEPVYRKRKSE